MKIEFLGIGVPKAATSWLHVCLDEHPMVFVPTAKEVHYFSRNYERGKDWYLDFFRTASDEQVVGEYSPSYLHTPNTAEKIYQFNPEMKMIAIFRDPVARAYSHFIMDVRQGKLANHIDSIMEVSSPGFYYRNLMEFKKYFKQEQILVLIYDDLMNDSWAFLQQVYRFLNIDPTFQPSVLNSRFNVRKPMPKYERIYQYLYEFWRSLKKFKYGRKVVNYLRIHGVIDQLHTMIPQNEFPDFTKEKKRELAEYYSEDIKMLSNYLGRDLTYWLESYK